MTSSLAAPRSRRSDWIAGAIAVVLVIAAMGLGQLATFPHLAPWYESLRKPWFTPPNWLFGPAWTLLYLLMGFAFWRIARLPSDAPGRTRCLVTFLVMLALNVGWSFAFFAAENPTAGLVDIALQWLAIIATMSVFSRVDLLASWCFSPLLMWVSYAAALNLEIWRLN